VGYLLRRIEFLLKEIEKGSLLFPESFANSENGRQLIQDIFEVRKFEDGSVDISSCSPLVRSLAKAIFSLHMYDSTKAEDLAPENSEHVSINEISTSMKEYFQLVEDFFVEVTGKKAEDFDFEEYRSKVLSLFSAP
jgi:hypothetical protein